MTEPSRAHRAYAIAMCAIIGGAFAYAACDWGRWPRLTYLPLTGKLTWSQTPQLSITYIGNVAWGIGGATVGAALGALLAPRVQRIRILLGAWAITAILLAGSYFTWSLWPW